MKLNRNIAILALLAAMLSGAGLMFLYQKAGDETTVSSRARLSKAKARHTPGRSAAKVTKKQKAQAKSEFLVVGDGGTRARLLAEAADEERSLTPEMASIVASLQSCLDDEDRKTLTKICDKIARIRRERGEEAVPAMVREKAVETIGYFLPGSLAEILPFLADPNPDVAEAAADQFDEVLNDASIGDRELSSIIVMMANVIDNEDTIDSMMMSIDSNMRNSVKVSTCNQILENGTKTIVKQLRETIADILEVEVDELPADNKALQKKLNDWLKENPDDEDDEALYKGVEDDE